MRQRVIETTKSFFFSNDGREGDDNVVRVVCRDPEAAAWFIELTMLFSSCGCSAAFLASTAFLGLHWHSCGGCDRPLRLWLLVQSLLQVLQVPVRFVIFTTVRSVRLAGDDLEGSIRSLTSSMAWRGSKAVSLGLYAWFILGFIWWFNASKCEGCPGIDVLAAAIMGLSIARTLVALVVMAIIFSQDPEIEFQPPPVLEKREAATYQQIDALEVLHVSHKQIDETDEDESCAVCLMDFSGGDVIRRLPCKHLFHMSCIDRWLLKNKRCPLCLNAIDNIIAPEAPGRPYRRNHACNPHHVGTL
jgi:hypothetical protein